MLLHNLLCFWKIWWQQLCGSKIRYLSSPVCGFLLSLLFQQHVHPPYLKLLDTSTFCGLRSLCIRGGFDECCNTRFGQQTELWVVQIELPRTAFLLPHPDTMTSFASTLMSWALVWVSNTKSPLLHTQSREMVFPIPKFPMSLYYFKSKLRCKSLPWVLQLRRTKQCYCDALSEEIRSPLETWYLCPFRSSDSTTSWLLQLVLSTHTSIPHRILLDSESC